MSHKWKHWFLLPPSCCKQRVRPRSPPRKAAAGAPMSWFVFTGSWRWVLGSARFVQMGEMEPLQHYLFLNWNIYRTVVSTSNRMHSLVPFSFLLWRLVHGGLEVVCGRHWLSLQCFKRHAHVHMCGSTHLFTYTCMFATRFFHLIEISLLGSPQCWFLDG